MWNEGLNVYVCTDKDWEKAIKKERLGFCFISRLFPYSLYTIYRTKLSLLYMELTSKLLRKPYACWFARIARSKI